MKKEDITIVAIDEKNGERAQKAHFQLDKSNSC